MGERYYVTGVQLALLKVQNEKKREALVDEVVDKQFITNLRTLEGEKCFKKQMEDFECRV